MAGQIPGFRVVVRESILGFLFWNLFWNLAPAVWFYPLNEMGVTGYESAVVAWYFPLLFGLPLVGRLLKSRLGCIFTRLTTVACILLAHRSSDALPKLLITCLGNGTLFLSTTVSLFSLSVNVRRATFWGLILGFFAMLSSQIWCYSFKPAWFTNETNLISFGLCMLATLDKIISGDDWCLDSSTPISQPKTSTNWISASAGLSSLLYLNYWIFGEVSVITRWVEDVYPSPGPQPLPFGLPVLFCLAFGLFLGFNYNVSTNFFWWIIGTASFAGLYLLPSWLGYACGLMLAVYSMSLFIFMFDAFMGNGQAPPIRSMLIFTCVFFVELLFNIFSVAYNFVYEFGGAYARERSDLLIGAIMFFIGLAIFRNKGLARQKSGSIRECGPVVRTFLLIFILAGAAGIAFRMQNFQHRHPPKSRPETIRAAVWTCHFGFDNKGWSNALRAIDFFNKTDTDVIAILESDTTKPFLGNNDLTAIVGEKLGLYTDFGARAREHCWGVNLLSRFPIVYSEHHLLPSPNGELAPAIRAGLDVGEGRIVDIVVTHMGVEEDDGDRKLQALALGQILKRSADSAIFLGYITTKPFARDYTELTVTGRMQDIDTTDNDRWCEYILYRGLERLGYARITHGQLSDTELQMATFRLPSPGASKEEVAAMNQANKAVVTDPSKADPSIRFSEVFGQYAEGHRSYLNEHVYHMNTPKYFLPITNN